MLSANASINAKLTASSFSLGFASDVKILKVRNNLHSKIGEDYVIWVSWKWLLQERLLKYLLKFTKQFRKSLLEWVNVRSYSLYVFNWVQLRDLYAWWRVIDNIVKEYCSFFPFVSSLKVFLDKLPLQNHFKDEI